MLHERETLTPKLEIIVFITDKTRTRRDAVAFSLCKEVPGYRFLTVLNILCIMFSEITL